MENTPRPPLHPMLWVAAAAVILFAGVGTAHFLGLLPGKPEALPTTQVPTPAAPNAPAAVSPTAAAPAAPAPAVTSPAAPVQKAPHKPATPAKPEPRPIAPPSVAAPPTTTLPPPPPYVSVAPCKDCGTIESVNQISQEGQGSGLGAIAGGVLGGVLGHNVGRGRGQDVATVAGAVGGAVLGNKIEKSQKTSSRWETTVRFEDGTSRIIGSDAPPPWRAGDRVKVVNGAIVPR